MPHKRAKRFVREQLRNHKGVDLVPGKQTLTNEAIPKSVARVLNAAKIREEWRNKKRKSDEDDHKQGNKRRKIEGGETRMKGRGREKETVSQLSIKHGESIQHFNRRVEDDMRPVVRSAMRSAHAVARNVHKGDTAAKAERKKKGNQTQAKVDHEASEEPPRHSQSAPDKFADRPKDFEKLSSSAPRRLNDVAQAPPEFIKLPRGVLSGGQPSFGSGKREGVLSMAQKSMMEKEREKAIARYREMKASGRKHGQGGEQDGGGVYDN